MLLPIDDLAVGVVGLFGTERWPADQTLEHDGANRPPVTAEGITCAGEDLWGNVVRGANCRVSEDAAGFAPGVDLGTVAYSQVDLVERDRLSVIALLLVSVVL